MATPRKRIPGARTWFHPVREPRHTTLFLRRNPLIADFYWLEDANRNLISRDASPKALADWATSNGYAVRDPDKTLSHFYAQQTAWPERL